MSVFSQTSLIFGKINGKVVQAQHWRTWGEDETDYELHLGTNWDYLPYLNANQLSPLRMTLSQNHCKRERLQNLKILKLALQNTQLVAFMLSGYRPKL